MQAVGGSTTALTIDHGFRVRLSRAGAYPAFLLASGIDVEEFHRTANRDFIEAVSSSRHRDPRVSPMRIWNDVLREHWTRGITSRLGGAEIERLLDNTHFISLTRLPTLENELVGEFSSIHDMVEASIASGHIPIYDRHGRLGASWRGELFVDGGVSETSLGHLVTRSPRWSLGPRHGARTQSWASRLCRLYARTGSGATKSTSRASEMRRSTTTS